MGAAPAEVEGAQEARQVAAGGCRFGGRGTGEEAGLAEGPGEVEVQQAAGAELLDVVVVE